MYNNVFYFRSILRIGGIESWFYYMSEKYSDKDITIVYHDGDPMQIRRLERKVRCIKWDGKSDIECVNLFINFNKEILDHAIVHGITRCVLHGDYRDMIKRKQLLKKNLPLDKRIDEYIGVSQVVCDAWKEVTGLDAKLSYNPIVLKPSLPELRLCSAQRLSAEKGKERIVKLCRQLDKYCLKHGYTYTYDIYTNEYGNNILKSLTNNEHITIKKSRMDVNRLFGNYDYFIALSDNEGYCYSVIEALCRGTQCIVTPLPVFEELGLNDSNSIKLEFDCSNVEKVVDEMFYRKYHTAMSFKYEPKNDSWSQFILDEPSTYAYKEEQMKKIKALINYRDTQEKQDIKAGDVYETTDERVRQITGSVYYSRKTGEPQKFAVETTEPINVSWQENTPYEEVEKPIEEVKEEVVTVQQEEEKPVKKASKPRRKKNDKGKSN